MTDSEIYVDTSIFIYYLEKSTRYFQIARDFFEKCYDKNIKLLTSVVTIEEYCVFPFLENNMIAIKNFNAFVDGMKISLVNVDKIVALEAAKIRAKYRGFKALDSIHLATALTSNVKTFLTNDKQLKQMKDLQVVTLEDKLWNN